MASEISLDAGMRSNLQSLQRTSSLLSRTEHRLSTGKDVNSPIDNPLNFFAARGLDDRANQLNARLDGMGQSIQTLQAANHGIDTIRDMVANMKALVNEAINEGDADQRRILGEQYNELLSQASTIAEDAGYQGVNLLTDNQTMTIQFGEDLNQSVLDVGGINIAGPSEAFGGRANIQGVGTLQSVASQAAQASQGSIASQAAVPTAASQTSQASVGSIASQPSISSQAAQASQPSQASTGTIASSQPSQAAQASLASQASVESRASVASSAAQASVGFQASIAFQPSVASQAAQASAAARTYVDSFAFSMNVTANDAGTTDVVGLKGHGVAGIAPGSHRVDFGSGTYKNDLAGLSASLEQFDSSLATQASRMTNNLTIVTLREEFTENMINTLEEGSDKLTLADMNAEGANLLALQTRHSLGIQSLALSSQNAQQVLRLLG